MYNVFRMRACFFHTIFVSSHMYPENPEGTQVIVGSMNMGYISDTARNRTPNLFRPKREPIPLDHSYGWHVSFKLVWKYNWIAVIEFSEDTNCTNMWYAMNILRYMGFPWGNFNWFSPLKYSLKILYVSPAWWGLMGREELLRIDLFLRRAKKLGKLTDGKMFEELCLTADDELFKKFRSIIFEISRQYGQYG